MMPLLVLRPEPAAAATARAAVRLGLVPVVAPLFAVRPLPIDPAALAIPRDALLVTSANAIRALGPAGGALAGERLFAVGEATAAAARAAGFRNVAVGMNDAAAIVATAADRGVRRLLHLAGREHAAVDVPGVAIERLLVYAADAVAALPPAATDALAAGAVVLLHSARAAALFARLADDAGQDRRQVALAALSPAVAQAAGSGWRTPAVAAAPTDAALLAAAARLCE